MPSVQLIRPKRHGDSRGWFTEVYLVPAFSALGIADTFMHDNHSLSASAFTLRGFLTVEPDCGVTHKCLDTYAPDADGGIALDSVGIDLPIPAGVALELSDKVERLPAVSDFGSPFAYDGHPLEPFA